MIKIDIVSGFLGSGKTTLIKKMLNDNKHEKVVVLENEFGQIGIDGELIKKDGLEVIELQNGCICCSIK
ncbi:GTP-binding protein, partial [Paraclostridium benzoelyticum]|nr:GTP-binding protein [Paraclostridium benzoelyticum]